MNSQPSNPQQPSYAGQPDAPSCYGIYWEAVLGSECERCELAGSCLERFATIRIPALQKQLGNAGNDPSQLAVASQVHETAVRTALAFLERHREAGLVTQEDIAPETGHENTCEPVKPRPKKKARTWRERWELERKRCPAIAKLIPGTRIRRVYRGRVRVVHVLNDRYMFKGREYPTLYAVTVAITGRHHRPRQRLIAGDEASRPRGSRWISNWSATRFFAKALRDL